MGRKLILIDDKPEVVGEIKGLILKWGLDYTVVANEGIPKPGNGSEEAIGEFISRVIEFVRRELNEDTEAILLDVLFEQGDEGPESQVPLGYSIGKKLRLESPQLPIILYTVRGESKAIIEAMKFNFDGYISKADFSSWRDYTNFEATLHRAKQKRDEDLKNAVFEQSLEKGATNMTHEIKANAESSGVVSRTRTKPRVFIGSSTESLEYATAIHENWEYENMEVTIWTQGVSKLSSNPLDDLITALGEFDFGIFIFSPQDILQIREQQVRSVRDNVIFELGLFIGRLGKERNFLVLPRNVKDFHLPTDLIGIKPATFNSEREDGNLKAALVTACNEMKRAIQKLGLLSS